MRLTRVRGAVLLLLLTAGTVAGLCADQWRHTSVSGLGWQGRAAGVSNRLRSPPTYLMLLLPDSPTPSALSL